MRRTIVALVLVLVSVAGQFLVAQSKAKADSATWTDPATGQMWAGQDNGEDVVWAKADRWCRDLALGGFRNWRLPEITELAGIYDPKQLVDGYHIKGGIRLSGVPWSSTAAPFDETERAWAFNFVDGKRHPLPREFPWTGRALCVRQSGK